MSFSDTLKQIYNLANVFFQLDQGISSSRLCAPVVVSKIFGGLAFQASIPPFTPGLLTGSWDGLGWIGMYGGDSTCTNLQGHRKCSRK